ncbi:PhoH family protein [Porticoccus sp.]|nr:PhoH family protein [Porticoccus sp.]MDC1270470.1 PhoH family protein [Porticoccus sp.]
MKDHLASRSMVLEPNDTKGLASLCGKFDEHLHQIEKRLNIKIHNRGNIFSFYGDSNKTLRAERILTTLYKDFLFTGKDLTADQIHLTIGHVNLELSMIKSKKTDDEASIMSEKIKIPLSIKTKTGIIKAHGANQQKYIEAIKTHAINFGEGPAGTGKTYLAVACAVESLLQDKIERILLVRPAVEAGEKLGFLPGDISQKVDPYLRPLYDALYEMLGIETAEKLIDRNIIEVAPLAFMRGRTLKNSYIILDESQNTTRKQMKMFLTRIGFNSTAVITGDASQIDLPTRGQSGLLHVYDVLKGVEGISFSRFVSQDTVRHPLVTKIVDAYETYEKDNL